MQFEFDLTVDISLSLLVSKRFDFEDPLRVLAGSLGARHGDGDRDFANSCTDLSRSSSCFLAVGLLCCRNGEGDCLGVAPAGYDADDEAAAARLPSQLRCRRGGPVSSREGSMDLQEVHAVGLITTTTSSSSAAAAAAASPRCDLFVRRLLLHSHTRREHSPHVSWTID